MMNYLGQTVTLLRMNNLLTLSKFIDVEPCYHLNDFIDFQISDFQRYITMDANTIPTTINVTCDP